MLDQPIDHLLTRGGQYQRRRVLPIWRMLLAVTIVIMAGIAGFPYLPRYYISYANVVVRPTNLAGETNYTQTAHDSLDENAVQTKMDMLASLPLQRLVFEENNLFNDPEIRPHRSVYLQRLIEMVHPPSGNEQGEAIAKLGRMLTVKREKHSYLIQVGYESTDPVKSARLTNALASAFVADGIERKRQLYKSGLDNQQQKIAALQALYTVVETEEHNFLVSSGLIHRSEIESLHRQLVSMSEALATAHAKAFEATDRFAVLNAAQRNNTLDSVDEAMASPLLQRLRERLIGLSTGAGAGFGSGPSGGSDAVITGMKQSINVELQRIVKAAQTAMQLTEAVETSLKDEIARIDTRLTALQASERSLDTLDRRLTAVRTALTDALIRYDTDTGKQFQADVEIVSPAVPSISPVFPNILIYSGGVLMLATLAAGLLALPKIMQVAAR